MTTLSSVNANQHTQRGKQIGTIVGAGVGGGYLVKNGKDIFVNGIQEGLKGANVPQKKAIPIAIAVSIATLGLATGVGRLIGAGIGKIVDKIEQKKEINKVKDVIAETINSQKDLKDIETISFEEMQKINDMSDEEAEAYISSRFTQTKVEE